jgi:uroporphyrinogen-III synthase
MSGLAGKRIIVTRPVEGADSLLIRIRDAGAHAVLYPTIVIGPPDDWSPIDDALRSLDHYDWLLFTSAAAVRAVFHRAREIGILPDAWRTVRIAAVGPATASAVQTFGRGADVVPERAIGAAMAEAVPDVHGRRFLFVRGDLALEDAPAAIRARGGIVDETQAYATRVHAGIDGKAFELLCDCDAITFTSPSTLRGFLNALGPREWPVRAAIVTIGPTTSAAVQAAGLTVTAEATEHSEDGLMHALASLFSAQHDGGME